MKTLMFTLLAITALGVTACPAEAPPPPGGKAAGKVIGAEFDGSPLTVGKGKLEGKALVITYFATW